MKKIVQYLIVGALALAIPASLSAQISANDDAAVTVTVQAGLTMTNTGGLDFGEITTTGAPQTITVAATAGAAATFTATGEPNTSVFVNWTAPGTLLHTDLATTLVFQNETVRSLDVDDQGNSVAIASTGDAVTLHATLGERYFWVGGEIVVGSTQKSGAYSGLFNLEVAY